MMIPSAASAVMSTLSDAAENILQGIHKLLKLNMSLEEVANMYSKMLDEIIISDIAKGYQYENGRFSLKYLDDRTFEALYELYFTKDGSWHKRDHHSPAIETKYLAKAALDDLRRDQVVSFTIERPAQEDIDAVVADNPQLAGNLKRV